MAHGRRPPYQRPYPSHSVQAGSGNDMQYVSILADPREVETRFQQRRTDVSSTTQAQYSLPSRTCESGRPHRQSAANDYCNKQWEPDSMINGYSQSSSNCHDGSNIPSSNSFYPTEGFPSFASLASSSSAWATTPGYPSQPSSADNHVFYDPVTSSDYFDLKSPLPQCWPSQSGDVPAQYNMTSSAQDDSINQLYAAVREGMGGSMFAANDQQLPRSKRTADVFLPDSSTFGSPARVQKNLPGIAAFFGPSMLVKDAREPCSDTSIISIQTKPLRSETSVKKEAETSFQRTSSRLTSVARRSSMSNSTSLPFHSSRHLVTKIKKISVTKLKKEMDMDVVSHLKAKLPVKSTPDRKAKKLKIESLGKPSLAEIPSALPEVETDIDKVESPQPLDPSDSGFFQKAVASIPPPLMISINGEKVSDLLTSDGEPKKSLRLRIKLSSLKSSVLETVEPKSVAIKLEKKSPVRSAEPSTFATDEKMDDDVVFVSSTVPDKTPFIVPKTSSEAQPAASALGCTAQPGGEEVFDGTNLTCQMLLKDMTSPSCLLAFSRLERVDFRAIFDKMPAQVQYEVMSKVPKSFTSIDATGHTTLKAGALSKADAKFKLHLSKWQANLASGEFDTEVRRRYIEHAIKELDPWKIENFEPLYGEIMRSSGTGEDILKALQARPSTSKGLDGPQDGAS